MSDETKSVESVYERARKAIEEAFDRAEDDQGLSGKEANAIHDALDAGEAAEARDNMWRNEEVACCPKDVGFPEYIQTLLERAEKAECDRDTFQKALELASSRADLCGNRADALERERDEAKARIHERGGLLESYREAYLIEKERRIAAEMKCTEMLEALRAIKDHEQNPNGDACVLHIAQAILEKVDGES